MCMKYSELIEKYNVPAPRYTSYPTVPFWEEDAINQSKWLEIVKKSFDESNEAKGISIYIHLPFCESLCTYCGCNKRITKNHAVEKPYLDAVIQEWKIYLQHFEAKPKIREIHLGGGTPTFFSPENLSFLIREILKDATVHPDHEFSLEGHPNNTTVEHMQSLYELGFRRISFGVQDFDEKIQRTINRIQPYENVARVTLDAKKIGFQSVNFDLVYGLPFQNLQVIEQTIDLVGNLMPQRIAYYSYAHVPWKMPSQRGYTEADLPDNEEKRALYELGKQKLSGLGYEDIGMDHFALPGDELLLAKKEKRLHRNFMGYTTSQAQLMIGLGTSAISDAKYAYAQNRKVVEDYKAKIQAGNLAIFKGHFLTEEDLEVKSSILALICKGVLNSRKPFSQLMNQAALAELKFMEQEGLIAIGEQEKKLTVTDKGFAFIRNIAMLFDRRLQRKKSSEPLFSKSI